MAYPTHALHLSQTLLPHTQLLHSSLLHSALPSQLSTEHFPRWSSCPHLPTMCPPDVYHPSLPFPERLPRAGDCMSVQGHRQIYLQCMEGFLSCTLQNPTAHLHIFASLLTLPEDSGLKMSCECWPQLDGDNHTCLYCLRALAHSPSGCKGHSGWVSI